MLREVLLDEFFEKQPDLKFVEDLKRYEIPKIKFRETRKGEVCPQTICLDEGVFASEALLETSFDDFDEFLSANDRKGKEYAVRLVQNAEYGKEEYSIEIGENGCTIEAGEKEGVRRALIRFEDDMLVLGGNLRLGRVREKIVIERRISRCFFAPINRPPKNLAELNDDVDYYPEAYLNRLMHDGVNAVWVYAEFEALVRSSYIKEFGEGREKRIEKLNSIIEKCAKYGIEVFVFLITPLSLQENAIVKKYPDLAEKYPQVLGNSTIGPVAFCTYTPFGEGYLSEAVENLIKSAPKLGGLMSITFGERVTSCGNSWPKSDGSWSNNCPHCKDKSRMEIITHTVDIIKKSMAKVDPTKDFISWTYGHRLKPLDMIGEYVDKCPSDAIMMQNFEDDGRVMQLGKKRFALDYYLCYAGPSGMFEFTAKRARKHGKKIYAKMQICCSHELATVPYIPVPGLVYDKMVGAKALGVSGVMESWFFGNYPCLMSKAVGMLSVHKEYESKREFLTELAGIYWNGEAVDAVVNAWECFEKAYTAYPVNVMFNYYGPMHDGIVWELALLPKNFSLPRTWQLTDRPDGDRIGECLFNGHTIEEAIQLSTAMCEDWQKGLDWLATLPQWTEETNEQISVAKALGLLFDSGNNILQFYKLRNDLGYGRGEAKIILSEMRELVEKEIENSKKMIPLCEADNRLGYHSEAEGYKFFPAKLKSRIENLKRLLTEEFLLVQERIERGFAPLAYFDGEEEDAKSYEAGRCGLESANWQVLDDGISKFRIAENGERLEIELRSDREEDFYIANEFELFFPLSALIVKSNGELSFHRDAQSHQSLLDEKIAIEKGKWSVRSLSENGKTHLILSAKKAEIGFVRFPYKCMVRNFHGANWCVDPTPVRVLGKCLASPMDYGWIK